MALDLDDHRHIAIGVRETEDVELQRPPLLLHPVARGDVVQTKLLCQQLAHRG